MRHGPVARQRGVLEGPVRLEPGRHEVGQCCERLVTGDGEGPGSVDADRGEEPRCLPHVEVATHGLVDRVLGRPPWLRHAEGDLAARRGLSVLGVEVPSAAHRLDALHQHSGGASQVAVEVLLQQPLRAAALCPACEVGLRQHESPARQNGGSKSAHQPPGAVRGGLDHLGGSSAHGLGIGVCRHQLGPVAELGRPVAQRREHQVRLLPVVAGARQHSPRLDQEHRPVVVVEEVGAELVGEQPAQRR